MLNSILTWLCYEAVCIRHYINLISSVVLLVKDSLFRKDCSLSIFYKVVEVKKILYLISFRLFLLHFQKKFVCYFVYFMT